MGKLNLELKIPPVVVAFLFAVAMWFVSECPPTMQARSIVGMIVCGAMGCTIIFAGIRAFRKARTTVNPLQPEQSHRLVTNGIYSVSRNPMYLGMALLLAGWAFYLCGFLSWLGVIGFVSYMTYFQIRPEEAILTEKFGKAYQNYCKTTRRWI